MTTRLISSSTEPLTAAEAISLCTLEAYPETITKLAIMIPAARTLAEQATSRSIALATWETMIDAFPADNGGIRLLNPPILTVESFTYVDANGATQTLAPAAYYLDIQSEPGWVLPVSDTDWPETDTVANAVIVRYTAGFGADCPAAIKQWMALHIRHWHDNPGAAVTEPIVSSFADALLDRYRIHAR